MKRYLIIDGSLQIEGTATIPHTSFDSLRAAKRFLMTLEDEAVYIKDRISGEEWYYDNGRIVQEREVY